MIDRDRRMSRGWLKRILWGVSALGVLGLGSVQFARAQAAAARDNPSGSPTAEAILRRTADFVKQARSFAFEVERIQKFGGNTLQTTCTVDFLRPNRFAFRAQQGDGAAILAATVVCDGKKLFIAIPAFKKYTEADAPASFDALLKSDPIGAGVLQSMLTVAHFLCAEDPYAMLMDGVNAAKYAGLEMRDGIKVHHLTFAQDQFDWELWVAAVGDPIIQSVVMDFTKTLAKMPGVAEQLKNQKMEIVQTYRKWRIGPDFDEKTFAFQPPEGLEKAESLLGASAACAEQQELSPLVGKPAPDVELKQLDGGDFRLKDHRDARLVMLDFWATWCGPCVMELPILTEVADAYKDKGVVFCGVNQREKPDEIRQFLKEKKLKFTVALDPEGEVGQAYHAEGIPLLVLIDKKGVVQSVHLGYNPSIKTTLTKELDDLLAGKDLAREVRMRRDQEKAKLAAESRGLERAWSASGSYASVAADPKGQHVFALERGGRCDVLDRGGKTTRTFRLTGGTHSVVRFARLPGGADGLFAFDTWGPSVLASRGDGTKLWEETGGEGIDDVWAADLDGDGSDEAIVGYNGATGLHVFGIDGKRLWKRTDLGNVWHVTAGDLDGDGKLEVVTTSAQGKVHVFAPADGQPLRTLDAGLYANMVRTVPALRRSNPSQQGDIVLVIGQGPSGEAMAVLGGDGKRLWSLDLPADVQTCDSLAVAPDATWAAAGLRGGRVCVVDVRRGQIVAQTSGQGLTPMVAWVAGTEAAPPLLLVANGRELNAFEVKPVETAGEKRSP